MAKKISNLLLALALGGLILAGSAFAQTSTSQTPSSPQTATPSSPQTTPAQPATGGAGPGVVDPNHPRVNQVNGRLGNQVNRIQQGVKNGSLTPQQAGALGRKDAAIKHQEQKDMAEHGGHLTKQEQRHLNKELNKQSKNIKKEKNE